MGTRSALVAALVVPLLCAPAVAQAAPAVAKPANFPADVLTLTNQQRTANGCGALTSDPKLTGAAARHNIEMAQYGYFDHNGRTGDTPQNRIDSAGYPWTRWAENIGYGYAAPADVVNAWMNSPTHRENILDCALTQIGIAYDTDSRGRAYWTQDFGTPRR